MSDKVVELQCKKGDQCEILAARWLVTPTPKEEEGVYQACSHSTRTCPALCATSRKPCWSQLHRGVSSEEQLRSK